MNHELLDAVSTEDEGVDEELMFEFEQELDARLSLDDRARMRPPNPVASVLQHADDDDDDEDMDAMVHHGHHNAFASLSASPSVLRMASPLMSAMEDDRSSSFFDDNGRRKRKFVDDLSAFPATTPRVRPMAKRAKSFSCVSDVLLPTATTASMAAASTTSVFGSRSDSIQIPRGRTLRPSALHPHHRSSSFGPMGHGGKSLLDLPAVSSDPLAAASSTSWNASVEYFCRRSLDISSPLRLRFRDLVVGSAGRAGSLQTP